MPHDFWHVYMDQGEDVDSVVDVTVLLPNGIAISFDVSPHATIYEIKEESWKKAEKSPLFTELLDKSMYEFETIGRTGRMSVLDETMRICDVRPYFCVFKIRKRKRSTDNNLKQQISQLIGTSDEFKTTNPEVSKPLSMALTLLTRVYVSTFSSMTSVTK